MNIIKLKKADCREILNKTFPTYRGRKYNLRIAETYYIYDSYWDGGSRIFAQMIRFQDNQKKVIPEKMFEGKEFKIANNILIVEHSYFCGKDTGITFICSPNSEFIKGKNYIMEAVG